MHRILFVGTLGIVFGASPLQAAEQEQPKAELKQLLADVKSADEASWLSAIIALADFGPEAAPAIGDLIATFWYKNDIWSYHAAFTLGKIGKAAVPELSRLLGSPDEDTRYFAVWSLSVIGPDAKDAAGKIVTLLKEGNVSIRRKAAYTLGHIQPDPEVAIPGLLKAMGDIRADVRRAAADGVARFGERAVPGLIKTTRQSWPEAQAAAIHALGVIGPEAKQAIGELKTVLKGKDPALAAAAADALGQIDKVALPTLIDAAKHGNAVVRLMALCAVANLGGDVNAELSNFIRELPTSARIVPPGSLSSLPVSDKVTAASLAASLMDPSKNGNIEYVLLLSMGSDAVGAVPFLIVGLKREEPSVRVRSALILGNIGRSAKAAVPALTEALNDSNPQARNAVQQALVQIGPK